MLAKITSGDGSTIYLDPMAVTAVGPATHNGGGVAVGVALITLTGGTAIPVAGNADELAAVIDGLRRRILGAMQGGPAIGGELGAALAGKAAAPGPRLVKG